MAQYGCIFDEVSNGYDALRFYQISSDKNNNYKAIFINSELPIINGRDTAKLLWEYEVKCNYKHVPIIGIGDTILPIWCDYFFTTPLKLHDIEKISEKLFQSSFC